MSSCPDHQVLKSEGKVQTEYELKAEYLHYS